MKHLPCCCLPLLVWCAACSATNRPRSPGAEPASCARYHLISAASSRQNLAMLHDSLIAAGLLLPSDSAVLVSGAIPPAIVSQAEVDRLLRRHFPKRLQKAGGVVPVRVWAIIDPNGKVERAAVIGTPAPKDAERAALRLTRGVRFTPAQYEGCRIRARLDSWITFNAHGR